MEPKTINIIKIILDILLLIALIYSAYNVYNYRAEVQEALGLSDYSRLLTIYEKNTGWNCSCGYYTIDTPKINIPKFNMSSFNFTAQP